MRASPRLLPGAAEPLARGLPGARVDSAATVVVGHTVVRRSRKNRDRRDDASNVLYREYNRTIDANGGSLGNDTQVSAFQSNPGADPYAAGSGQAFIGDYQDSVFYTFASGAQRWINAWIGIPTSTNQFDIYLSSLQ